MSRAFLAILAGGLILRILLFPGTQGTDDLAYKVTAHRIVDGTFTFDGINDPKCLRWAVLLPLALVQTIFGAGEFTGAVLSVLSWIAVVTLVYAIARRCAGERAALFAAAICAICPLDIHMSTVMFPEMMVAAFGLGALLLCDRAVEEGRIRLFVWAGLLIGIGYLAKENAIYWIPAILLWIGNRSRPLPWRGIGMLLGAALAVFAAECAFYAVITNQALFRVASMKPLYMAELEKVWYPTGGAILRRLTVEPLRMLCDPSHQALSVFGGVFLAAAAGAAALWRSERARIAGPLLIFLGLVLAFNFFPARVWPFLPNTFLYRYAYPLLIPCYLIVGVTLDAWIARGGRVVLWGCVAGFLFLQAWVGYVLYVDAWNVASCGRQAARKALGLKPAAIHTDPRTVDVVGIVGGFRKIPAIRRLTAERAVRPGDMVIINEQALKFREARYGIPIDPFYRDLPTNWEKVAEFAPMTRWSLRALMTREKSKVVYDVKADVYIVR